MKKKIDCKEKEEIGKENITTTDDESDSEEPR